MENFKGKEKTLIEKQSLIFKRLEMNENQSVK